MVQVTPPADWSATAMAAAAVATAAETPMASFTDIPATPSSLDSTDVLAFLEPPPIASQPTAPVIAGEVATSPGVGVVAKLIENWWMLACGVGIGVVLGLGGWMIATMASQTDQSAVAAVALAQSAPVPSQTFEHTVSKSVETSSAVDHAHDSVTEKATQTQQVEDAAGEEVNPGQNVTPATEQSEPDVEAPMDAARADASAEASPEPAEAIATAAEPVVAEEQGSSELPQPSAVDKAALNAAHQEAKVEAPPLRLMGHKQVKDRLSERLPAIEFDNKVPLEQFTRFVAQLSGVQVDIDPAALADIRKAGGAPVSVKLENASIAKVLQTAVSQHGLTCVLQDDKVLIRKK